jgi:hypothetical protein
MSYIPPNPNGQATKANSAPVVIASDQGNLNVAIASGNITNYAQETGGNLASVATNTTNIPNVVGTAASAVPSKLVQVGGSDGTNARAIKTNTSGQLDVRPLTSSDQVTIVPSGTQTVSGTVTANVGTTNGLALDATLTGGNLQAQGNVASAATDAGNPVKVGAKYNATRPTFTDGQRADLQVDPRGNLGVMIYNGANTASYGADNADGIATSATADKMRVISRNSVYNGSTYDRMMGDTTNGVWVNVKNTVATPAGTNLIGKVGIDQTTPGTTNAVVDTPVTSGGLSIVTGSVGGTATAIKASAGQLYGYHLFNTTAAVAYVQIFNVAAGSVTLGTTTPTISIGIPASGGVTVNFDKGIAFGTAISFACTTTRTGSTGATCDVNFFYK